MFKFYHIILALAIVLYSCSEAEEKSVIVEKKTPTIDLIKIE